MATGSNHFRPGAPTAARLLALAAAPIFTAMAVASGLADGLADPICAASGGARPLTSMTAMYALMSIFHLAPWLRFAGSRRASTADRQGEMR